MKLSVLLTLSILSLDFNHTYGAFQQVEVLFPTSDMISWAPLVPEMINCSKNAHPPKPINSTKVLGYVPLLHKNYDMGGFLCTGVILHTRCTKSFFGSTYIEHLEEHLMPQEQECITAIQEYRKGVIRQEAFPDPVCSWLKTSSNIHKVSHISEKTVSYDPYYDRSVSEIFPQGYCASQSCRTINPGQIWYSDYNKKPQCLSESLETIYFYFKYYAETLVGLWSPDIAIPVGHKLCSKRFCGMNGLLFPDGSWVGFKSTDVIGQKRVWELEITVNGIVPSIQFHRSYETLSF